MRNIKKTFSKHWTWHPCCPHKFTDFYFCYVGYASPYRCCNGCPHGPLHVHWVCQRQKELVGNGWVCGLCWWTQTGTPVRRYYGRPVEWCAQVLDLDGKTSVKCQGKNVSKLKRGTRLKWVESPGSDVAVRVCEADWCVLDQAVGGSCDGRGGSMKGVENCTHQTRRLSLSSWPVLKLEPTPSCSARAPFLRLLPWTGIQGEP